MFYSIKIWKILFIYVLSKISILFFLQSKQNLLAHFFKKKKITLTVKNKKKKQLVHLL